MTSSSIVSDRRSEVAELEGKNKRGGAGRLSSLIRLSSPSRVIKTTYAPMIYTALSIMFWMRAYPLLGEVGGGWALNSRVFGPQMALTFRLDAISQGPKTR
jgi:hypothetical protein